MATSNEAGDLFPDMMDLPDKDQWLETNLAFAEPKDGGSIRNLILTITNRDMSKLVHVNSEFFDNIHLVASYTDTPAENDESVIEFNWGKANGQNKRAHRTAEVLRSYDKIQIVIEFQDDWLAKIGNKGTFDLQAVFSTDPIEFQDNSNSQGAEQGNGGGQKGSDGFVEKKIKGAQDFHRWQGTLTTPPIKINLADLKSLPTAKRLNASQYSHELKHLNY